MGLGFRVQGFGFRASIRDTRITSRVPSKLKSGVHLLVLTGRGLGYKVAWAQFAGAYHRNLSKPKP